MRSSRSMLVYMQRPSLHARTWCSQQILKLQCRGKAAREGKNTNVRECFVPLDVYHAHMYDQLGTSRKLPQFEFMYLANLTPGHLFRYGAAVGSCRK